MSGRKEEPLVWESMAERTEKMMKNKKSVQGPLYMITTRLRQVVIIDCMLQ